jgi:phospholipid N-methyltransferase
MLSPMPTGDSLRFFGAFLRHPTHIGAVAPSSPGLARAMVAGLSLRPGQGILEYGPGTGPFTAALEKILGDPKAYLGIERDARFVDLLRQRHPRLRFVAGSAENARDLAARAGLSDIGAVLCGLPFASLPDLVQQNILADLGRLLPPGRIFRTFQYVHAYPLPQAVRFRRRMTARFGPMTRSAVVWANLPPAFVLTWRRRGAEA